MTALPSIETDDLPAVLDACCGSRMFWFDQKNPQAIFADKRNESYTLADSSSKHGSRTLVVDPDIQCDFTALPFRDGRFALVVFDPPHLIRNGKSGWLAKKYGKLEGDWKEELRQGFSECFRVLKPDGVLIFKWNETDILISQILALTPEKPLFGHRTGKRAKTHWVAFLKPPVAQSAAPRRERPACTDDDLNAVCIHCQSALRYHSAALRPKCPAARGWAETIFEQANEQ